MKKALIFLFALLPFVTTSIFASPTHHKRVESKMTLKTSHKTPSKKGKSTVKTVKKSSKNTVSFKTKSVNSNHQNKKVKTIQPAKKSMNSRDKKAIVSTVSQKTSVKETKKLAYKSVIVPQCRDFAVEKVLADAFKQQGLATNTPMAIRHISQVRETQYYPKKGIRSCHAMIKTQGKTYQTDYSIILNDKGFFVQVENAL